MDKRGWNAFHHAAHLNGNLKCLEVKIRKERKNERKK
jgi:hypothetical protein